MGRLGHGVGLLFRNRDFASLWASELISTLGDRVHRVALAALVYQLTGSLTETGIAFMATALPDLFLGLIAGALVDRWDRRRAMIACDLLRVPPVLLIPLVAQIHLWLVYLLLLIVNTLSIVFRPAKTALIPSIVRPEELNAANSISSITENTSDVLGYPLAGILLGAVSAALGPQQGLVAAFGFDALTFLISAVLVAGVRRRPSERVERAIRSIWSDLGEGVHFVRGNAVVRSNTLVMLLGPLTLGAATPLLVGYAWQVLRGGEWEYAMLGTGIGAGSILAGFGLSTIRSMRPGNLVVAGLAIMGLGVMGAAAVASLWPAVLFVGLSGAGQMLVMVPSVTLVQNHTPSRLLGRIFSVRSTLIFAAVIFSNAAGGWAGQNIGVRPSLFMFGALLVVSVLIAGLSPSVRQVELTPLPSDSSPLAD